jgi:membrane protease YdiL (CAAX protease family)
VWDWLPAVSGSSVASAMLAAYLVLGIPAAGLITRRGLRQEPAPGSDLRLAIYRGAISRQWLLAGVAVGIAGLAGLPVSALGLRGPRLVVAGVAGFLAEAALLVTVAIAVMVLAGRAPGRTIAGLLPVTREERTLYAGVAVTAGFVEELLFRGFLMQYAMATVGWSWQSAALASAAAFGISHLYQGPTTALRAAMVGFGFAESYTLTGSLLVPVLLHIALDLRVLAWPGARPLGSGGQKCSGASESSSRSPVWNTCGDPGASTPSPSTSSRVGAVLDA